LNQTEPENRPTEFSDIPAARKNIALAVIIIPVCMFMVFFFSVLYSGTPGFRVDKTQNGLKIEKIKQKINPVMPGDIIISINGMPYPRILSCFFHDSPGSGKNTIITILRQGKKIQFTPELINVSPSQFLRFAWPHLILIIMLIALGMLSYLRASAEQPALLFLISTVFFATTFSATIPSHFGILAPRIISLSFFTLAVSNWIAFGACLHFVFSFPVRRNIIKKRKALIPVFYLFAPAVSIAGAFLPADNMTQFWPWLQRLRNIGLPVIVLVAFAKHCIDFRSISGSLEKNQIKLIISSYWLSFGPYLIFYAIPNIAFNTPFMPFRLVVLSSAILPGAYFIALVRYRLLDTDKMISRTIAYIFLICLLFFSYSYLMILLKRSFIGRSMYSEEFFMIYIIAATILFGPANRIVSGCLDRIFMPEAVYNYTMLPAMTRQIGTCVVMKDLGHMLTHTIPENFHIQHIILMVFNDTDINFYPESSCFDKLHLNTGLLKLHLSSDRDYIFCGSPHYPPELMDQLNILQNNGIELIFALRCSSGLAGIIFLGKRQDEKPYTRRDIEIFITIFNQAGLALENALHYESLVKSKKQIERMFKKVAQAEKLAALGEMATSLAHELKNPLGIIRSSAQYLSSHDQDHETRIELLEYIIAEVDNLESVISNMLKLARFKSPELSSIHLCRELALLLERWTNSGNHNKKVNINLEYPDSLPEIKADFRQLQQVFLNCITNAEEVMPDGGNITIIIENTHDSMVSIRIMDTGPGIAEQDIENAFKKFFTTKEKGMGIGLPVCRQIISAHNGTISIKNRSAGGLCVNIHLPCNPLPDPGRATGTGTEGKGDMPCRKES